MLCTCRLSRLFSLLQILPEVLLEVQPELPEKRRKSARHATISSKPLKRDRFHLSHYLIAPFEFAAAAKFFTLGCSGAGLIAY